MITKNALKCTFPLLLKLKILIPAEATPKPFLKQSLPPFTEWRKSAILIFIHNMQTDLCNFLKTNTAYADNVKHNNRAHGNNVFTIWCFTPSDSVSAKISSLESRSMET